jgi:hypothetical protein
MRVKRVVNLMSVSGFEASEQKDAEEETHYHTKRGGRWIAGHQEKSETGERDGYECWVRCGDVLVEPGDEFGLIRSNQFGDGYLKD